MPLLVAVVDEAPDLRDVEVLLHERLEARRHGLDRDRDLVGAAALERLENVLGEDVAAEPVREAEAQPAHAAALLEAFEDLLQARLVEVEDVVDDLELLDAVLVDQEEDLLEHVLGRAPANFFAEDVVAVERICTGSRAT